MDRVIQSVEVCQVKFYTACDNCRREVESGSSSEFYSPEPVLCKACLESLAQWTQAVLVSKLVGSEVVGLEMDTVDDVQGLRVQTPDGRLVDLWPTVGSTLEVVQVETAKAKD